MSNDELEIDLLADHYAQGFHAPERSGAASEQASWRGLVAGVFGPDPALTPEDFIGMYEKAMRKRGRKP